MLAAELMFFGIELNFIGLSFLLNDISGIIISFLIISCVVAESVIGFSLCFFLTKINKKIYFNKFQTLRF